MKKSLLTVMALCVTLGAASMPKSVYVKKGDSYIRYNFGVAGMLNFSNNGKTLAISGYNELINLDEIDYITFDAPVSEQALTPSAQKEKLIQIGEAVNRCVNLKENSDVIDMFHFFFDHIEVKGQSVCPPSEFDMPEEYSGIHVRKLVKSMSHLAHLNMTGGVKLAKSAVELYKVDDYLGVFTADYNGKKWVKTADANYLEFNYTPPTGENVNYSIRLTPSSSYSQWNTKDANVRLPETMDLVLKKDGKDLGNIRISSELHQDQQIRLAVDGSLGTAGIELSFNVVDNGIDLHTLLTNRGEYIGEINQHIDGKNLVNYDLMYEDIRDSMHHHDEYGNCIDEEPEKAISHFIRAKVSADILHLLQLDGRIGNPSRIYQIFVGEEEDDDNNMFEYKGYRFYHNGNASLLSDDKTVISSQWSDNPDEMVPYVNALNDYSDISFYYDGNKILQGFLGFDMNVGRNEWSVSSQYVIINGYLVYTYEYDGDYWVSLCDSKDEWKSLPIEEFDLTEKDVIRPVMEVEQYCDITPILIFPDGTSFYFEDYFDKDSFTDLINDYDEVIDTYYELTGKNNY